MTLIEHDLCERLTTALTTAGNAELVAELKRAPRFEKPLTSKAAANLLGVSSINTVKNWLEGGAFPGAFQTAGGHWRFPVADVLATKARMNELREKNRTGDLAPPDDDSFVAPPLL